MVSPGLTLVGMTCADIMFGEVVFVVFSLLSEPKDLYISTHLCVLTQLEVFWMKRVTFSIPKELKERLDRHPEINWSEVIKEGIKKKLLKLEKFEELESKGVI